MIGGRTRGRDLWGVGASEVFFVLDVARDLKSSGAFPFVGWTRAHQRHSRCCDISGTICEIIPMLFYAVPFRVKSTFTLSVFTDR